MRSFVSFELLLKHLKPAPSSEGAGFVNFCDGLAASSHRASRSLCGAKVKAKAKSEAGACHRAAAPVDCRLCVALNHCVIKLRQQLGGHYAQPRRGCQGAVCNGCWQAQKAFGGERVSVRIATLRVGHSAISVRQSCGLYLRPSPQATAAPWLCRLFYLRFKRGAARDAEGLR